MFTGHLFSLTIDDTLLDNLWNMVISNTWRFSSVMSSQGQRCVFTTVCKTDTIRGNEVTEISHQVLSHLIPASVFMVAPYRTLYSQWCKLQIKVQQSDWRTKPLTNVHWYHCVDKVFTTSELVLHQEELKKTRVQWVKGHHQVCLLVKVPVLTELQLTSSDVLNTSFNCWTGVKG